MSSLINHKSSAVLLNNNKKNTTTAYSVLGSMQTALKAFFFKFTFQYLKNRLRVHADKKIELRKSFFGQTFD